ncbi:MAG TPA: permease [Actinomycetales bacterium]
MTSQPAGAAPLTPPGRADGRSAALGGLLLTAVLAVVLLLWAKWLPYTDRIGTLRGTGAWSGSSILGVGGVQPGDVPTWQAGTSFLSAYLSAVWRALLAALLIAAALQAFVSRAWVLRVMNRRTGLRGAAVGGLLSTPSMMCTCCTAPVAATLSRSGVSTAAVVAYWLGNPLLNPAVLVFLSLAAPWEWAVTRLVAGVVLVVGGAALVARLAPTAVPSSAAGEVLVSTGGPTGSGLAGAPGRFARALGRMCVTLVPEYLLLVLAIGAFRGWLFPLGQSATSLGLLTVVLATVVGTLLVIPTAGEIPVLQGLALAGLSAGAIGALLVTLPAVSLPGMVMLGRSLGWRVTTTTAAVVAVGGLGAGGLLWALTG